MYVLNLQENLTHTVAGGIIRCHRGLPKLYIGLRENRFVLGYNGNYTLK